MLIFALLLFAEVSPTVPTQTDPAPTSDHLGCFQEHQAKQQQLRCFTDQGIHLSLPEYQTHGGSGRDSGAAGDASPEDQKQNYVNAMIAQNPERLCSRQRSFALALECAMNHTVSCMPLDYRGYLPQPRMMKGLVDKLCENTSKINFPCVKKTAESLFHCGFRKGQEAFHKGNQFISFEDYLCKAFQFNAQCQRTELRSCGCATVRLYESLSRDHLYPPECPRPMLEGPPTKCDVRNEAFFAESRAGSLSGHLLSAGVTICGVLMSLLMLLL